MGEAANDNIAPGQVYKLDEAAAHLRLTNRGVAKLARRHGLCMVRGRDILLTGKDIEAIKDVLRCPSNYTNVEALGGYRGPSKELDLTGKSKASVSDKARRLVIERSRKPHAQKLKAAS
jgi:hypothetical protein